MNAREAILTRVREALGRTPGQGPGEAPPPKIQARPEVEMDYRIARFGAALEKLNGNFHHAASLEEVRTYAARLIAGKTAVASNAGFLRECAIPALDGVASGFTDRAALREACATRQVGITSADFALADTGTLVMFSSPEEARMISLLPPCHLAIVPRERLLTGLDELLTRIPAPDLRSSSMVLITGPSRTADIEQILVRGVHGPGEIHVVVI